MKNILKNIADNNFLNCVSDNNSYNICCLNIINPTSVHYCKWEFKGIPVISIRQYGQKVLNFIIFNKKLEQSEVDDYYIQFKKELLLNSLTEDNLKKIHCQSLGRSITRARQLSYGYDRNTTDIKVFASTVEPIYYRIKDLPEKATIDIKSLETV